MNLPLGMVSFVFILLFYKETKQHEKHRIDWLGAITLVGAVVCLMFALELGGEKYAWDWNVILTLFGSAAVLLVCFLMIERKASEPIISFHMFKTGCLPAARLSLYFTAGHLFQLPSRFRSLFRVFTEILRQTPGLFFCR